MLVQSRYLLLGVLLFSSMLSHAQSTGTACAGFPEPCSEVSSSSNSCQLASTSSATVCVGLEIENGVRIWGLNNIEFPVSPTGNTAPANVVQTFCVFSNQHDGSYNLTVDVVSGSSTPNSKLILSYKPASGVTVTTDPINYSLNFKAVGSTGAGTTITTYGQSATFTNGGASGNGLSTECTTGNLELTASISSSLATAISGIYSDTIILTVGTSTTSAGGDG
ncbi:hypothetical protein [Parendozoicomonas haliclonae]|uniref:Uncharacterized protein n=1 Tax=Parendozoicomonas haliclonae TaxID=1960125 RepID=A0A1X7AG44_9GAMM|nr:hypothetical protein [Parendozoicomonas haliclonae]SMA39266.1 hypothetical protein EHSB41UT_00995 [Parendozoicomonas haliclonae]